MGLDTKIRGDILLYKIFSFFIVFFISFSEVESRENGSGGRRMLLDERSYRSLKDSCNVCPTRLEAIEKCSSLSQAEQTNVRNNIIASCGSSADNLRSCCASLRSDWSSSLNCLCAGGEVLEGLDAFVDITEVLAVCGCGDSKTQETVQTSVQTVSVNTEASIFSSNMPEDISDDIRMILDAQNE